MAKARSSIEAVNVVSKDVSLTTTKHGRNRNQDGENSHSENNTHSRYQTLEEFLYSLDSQTKIFEKISHHRNTQTTDLETDDSVDDVGIEPVTSHNEAGAASPSINQDQAASSSSATDDKDIAKQVRHGLTERAVLDLDTLLNDEIDIDDPLFGEDLEIRRQLLDRQLQRRIEQYYLEDLDLDSLTADDFATDFRLLGGRNFPSAKPDYPQSEEVEEECFVCFEVVMVQKRWCCQFPVCNSCMDQYLEIQVTQGIVKISCINSECSSFIHREEIYNRLSTEMKEKFYRFLVNANQDPHIKTCPKCSHVYNETELGSDDQNKFGLLVVCPECKLAWCFKCHSPWHSGVKCKDFQKGDKLVKHWAKEQHFGVNNAQKCPKCKIYIERKGGCDHMTCIRCNTGFCYRCGDRYRDLKIFGNHLSRYSIVGCKYNYMPNHPNARRFCRGSIFAAELLGGVVLLGLGVAAAALLLGASVVILPAFGGYKYHKRRRLRRHMKRQEMLFKMRTQNALVEMQRERAVLERYTEKLFQQTSNTDGDIGPVHIGIQTEQSQKVDVTVHSPSNATSQTVNEQTVDSKIRMNISDDRGHVTVTTAEITHNASNGDSSEAKVVLHVRTTYGNKGQEIDGEPAVGENALPDNLSNSDGTNCDSGSEKKSEEDLEVNENKNGSKSENSTLSLPKTKHNRTASLPSKSDTLKFKEDKKSCFGKQHFRHSERSRKTSKTRDSNSKQSGTETQSAGHSLSSNHDQGEAVLKNTEDKASDNQDESLENEALSQSGCFMKLFSRKLNTLQNQIGKEKEKNSLTRSLSEPIDYSNCPDLVSCILASELKNREAKDEVKVGEKEIAPFQPDALVATETCSTSF